VEVEPFAAVDHDAVDAQAQRLAPHRGCAEAEVTLSAG
jgi:hypothetical protein